MTLSSHGAEGGRGLKSAEEESVDFPHEVRGVNK